MNTCDTIMERKTFVFSLVSSSFSLCVRAVRERHLGPRAPLDSEKQSTSHMQWTQSPEGPSKTSHEAGGWGGGRSSASGCFPREAPTVPVAIRQAESLAPPFSPPYSQILSPTCEHSFNELGWFSFYLGKGVSEISWICAEGAWGSGSLQLYRCIHLDLHWEVLVVVKGPLWGQVFVTVVTKLRTVSCLPRS